MTLDDALQELSEAVGRIGRFPPDPRLDADRALRAAEALACVEPFIAARRAAMSALTPEERAEEVERRIQAEPCGTTEAQRRKCVALIAAAVRARGQT